MARKIKTDVVLTPAAREVFASEPLGLGLKDRRYFNCDNVEQRGSFLELEVSYPFTFSEKEELVSFRISIPLHFVLYTITADDETKRQMGFVGD